MRKKIAVVGGVAAAMAVVLGVTLSGVLAPSLDGTPVPNEATRALQNIDTASRSLADAPGATYDGTLTMALPGRSTTVDVTKLTVTAAGDVHGTVRQNGGSAELLQFAGKTFVKGDSAFWARQTEVKQPAGIITEPSPTGKWVVIDDAFLGIDLGAALRPSRLGLVLGQQDSTLGDATITGTDISRGGQTPDRRVDSGTDRPGVSEVEVEDADGGVEGSRRFQASSMTLGTDDDGALTALRGPLGKGFGGDVAKVDADLRVTRLDSAGVRDVYTKARTIVSDGGIGSWTMTVAGPFGNLDCNAASCFVNYDLTNAASGLDNGTVQIALSTNLKANGREVGTCAGSGTMPINGRGHVTCTIRYAMTSDVQSGSRFTLIVLGGIDPAQIDAAFTRGTTVSDAAEGWTMTAPKATETARRFHRQIALTPSGYAFTVDGFAFDGRGADGTLLLVHGPGYDEHVLPTKGFDPAWPGTDQIVSQARDAQSAEGDRKVRMVFAEPRSAEAARQLLIANRIENVEVVHVPLDADS